MKQYKKIVISCLCFVLVYFAGLWCYISYLKQNDDKIYQVEMNRIAMNFQETGQLNKDLSAYPHIMAVTLVSLDGLDEARLEGDENTVFWGIYDKEGQLKSFLCFKYKNKKEQLSLRIILGSCSVILIMLIAAFGYIYKKMIWPIEQVERLSEQMARGNISPVLSALPQQEFKGFRWGLKMLEDELNVTTKKNLALEKQRQTLVSSIAHGIKTPVANIIMYTSAISEKLYPEEKLPELNRKIEENAKKIHKLLDELLKTASKPSYEMKIEKKDFYLEQWLEVMKLNYVETLELLHIAFEMKSCPNCLIYSDLHALVNVASNMIDNAIKYGDGKWIQINVEKEEEMLYIGIENSGMPIPKNDVNAIFKSFYRGAIAEGKQGNGLGLYICKTIIKELDGTIYVLPKEASNQFVFAVPIKA